jgi:hypothetical protein
MYGPRVVSVFCSAFVILGLLAQPVMAVTGDVNGDDIPYATDDLVYLLHFLFENGPPPPNPIDAEVDHTAGINMGDVLQMTGVIQHDCVPIPEPYIGYAPSFGQIEFTFPTIMPGGTEPFDVALDLTDNPGPDLWGGIVLTFSYQHAPGHVGVDLNSVDFTDNIAPSDWVAQSHIDNIKKRALLVLNASPSSNHPLNAGTTGLIATLTFSRTENPFGEATFLGPTLFPPTHSPILIADYCAGSVGRMLIPKYVLGKNGDVNCDGNINEGDVIFLLNYLFFGASPPCVW